MVLDGKIKVKIMIFEKKVHKNVKKVNVFGLGYSIMNLWKKFIEVCEWCDSCEGIFTFF